MSARAECNCPPMTPRTMREGVGTKDPCPAHPMPPGLADVMLPAIRDLRISAEPFLPREGS